MNCKWYCVCPMKHYTDRGLLDPTWVEEYCKGGWSKCIRYKMAERGRTAPGLDATGRHSQCRAEGALVSGRDALDIVRGTGENTRGAQILRGECDRWQSGTSVSLVPDP